MFTPDEGNKLHQIDYAHFDPKFNNALEPIAPEFGEFHERRNQWIAENVMTWNAKPLIPMDISGLVPRKQRLPATRSWYRRTTSFERNGFFNIHTPVLNTKFISIFFPIFILYGWISFQIEGYNE